MPGVLLFCTTEEAKIFAPKVLSLKDGQQFYLAESRAGPTPGEYSWPSAGFKEELKDGETFETDFIGASIEDCGSWALQQQDKNNRLEKDVIAIVDDQSVKDQTVIMAIYCRDVVRKLLRKDQTANTWYGFRVPYLKSREIITLIPEYGNPSELYGVYFWRKEELTGENGIFDTEKALELYLKGDGRVFVKEDEEA